MENLDEGHDDSFNRKFGFEINRHPGRIPYRRQKAARLNPRSENDRLNQQLIRDMMAWLKPLEEYIKVGFRNYPGKNSPMAAALRKANKYASVRDPDNYHFIPNLISISDGDLAFEDDFKVLYNAETSELCIYWDIDLPEVWGQMKPASEDDRVMVAACPWWGGEVYGKVFGARRGDCCERVTIPRGDDPKDYYIYVAFTSADGTSQSISYAIDSHLWELQGALTPKKQRT